MSNEYHDRPSTSSMSPSTRPVLAPQSTPTPFRFTPTATAAAAAAATIPSSPASIAAHNTRKPNYEPATWTQFSRKPRFHSSPTPVVASPASDEALALAATAVLVDEKHNEPTSPEHKRRRKLPQTPEKPKPREPASTTTSSFKPPPRFFSSSTTPSFSSILSTPTAASTQTPAFRFTSLSAAAAAATAATADEARSEEPLLLSTIFSPRKPKSHSRFIKGGAAEQVRSWIVDASSSDALSFLSSTSIAGTFSSCVSSKAGQVHSRTHARRVKESGGEVVVLRVVKCFSQRHGKEQATDPLFCRCTITPRASLEVDDGDVQDNSGNEEDTGKLQEEERVNILLVGGGGGSDTLSSLSTRTLQEGSRIVLDRDTLGWKLTLGSSSTVTRSAYLNLADQETESMDGGKEADDGEGEMEEEWIVCVHGWRILESTSRARPPV